MEPLSLPSQGTPHGQLLAQMRSLRNQDVKWRDGKVFSLVFYAGEELLEVIKEAHAMFMSENGLNPGAFPSLRKFETEVVSMVSQLLHGDAYVVGNMTSGGTESILMAVKTAREFALARNPKLKQLELVLPVTAHPAFDKACHYFGIKPIHIPVDDNFRVDLTAFAKALSSRTILAVGSAPAYPHGCMDPIAEMVALTRKRQILFHVDACVGGMMLPFLEQLGQPIPTFDFRLPGVTSISVDLHKYGYAAKGASVVLYRSEELRRHQFFVYTDWPGGIYPSPTMTGTRPGGTIAAAWAVMNHLGQAGYLRLAQQVLDTTQALKAGIAAIEGIHVLGQPEMSILAIASDSLDIYTVGDEMTAKGWHLDRQQFPPSLHLTINAAHAGSYQAFLVDLQAAVEKAQQRTWNQVSTQMTVQLVTALSKMLPDKLFSHLMTVSASVGPKGSALPSRTAAMYGMIGALPNRGDVRTMVLDFMQQTYCLEGSDANKGNNES